MQMSLFATVKLSELYSFVHECGMWQSEKCYKTVIEVIHSSIVIANLYNYGSTEERERAQNAIVVDVLDTAFTKSELVVDVSASDFVDVVFHGKCLLK